MSAAETCIKNNHETALGECSSSHQAYLNLPSELWQLVFQYLSHTDILHGALVSPTRSLSQFCQSHIWARIQSDDWVFEGFHQGLARNRALIRRLACSPKARLDSLAVPECQSITHLDIEQMRFLSSAVLERILEYNVQSLQSLRIRLDRSLFEMTVEKLGKMNELKELWIQHWEGIHEEALERILRACPQLEILSLGHNSLYPFKLDNLRKPTNRFLSPLPSLKIRSLILDGAVIFHDDLVLNLASQCPDLENLLQLCSNLQRLNLTNQSTTNDFFQTLFCSLPRLKEIKVTGSVLSDEDVKVMIQHCSASLETLDVGLCTSLSSRSILAILVGCPSLIHLDARGVDFNPRDMEPTDTWTCTRLKSLYLEILLPRRSHYAVGEPDRIRNQLYSQLARLTSLRSLELGAGSKDRGVNILEMSLLTGLSTLATLTKLERLVIKRLNHAVRAAEVAWMIKNWPRLQGLGILLDTNADMELVRAVQRRNKSIYVW
ncbi:hypothetical protein EDD11_004127 [Mortierella claussenii]|nr:hypothetical protein EDD11_004127 [Mortierella claussenii]